MEEKLSPRCHSSNISSAHLLSLRRERGEGQSSIQIRLLHLFHFFFLFADFRGGGGEIFFIFSRQIALLRAGRNLIWREGKIQLHGISLGRHKRERMIIIRHPRSLKGRCHCRRKFYEKRQSFFKIKSISWKLRCLL